MATPVAAARAAARAASATLRMAGRSPSVIVQTTASRAGNSASASTARPPRAGDPPEARSAAEAAYATTPTASQNERARQNIRAAVYLGDAGVHAGSLRTTPTEASARRTRGRTNSRAAPAGLWHHGRMLGRPRSATHWVRVGLALLAPIAAVSPFGGCGLDTQGSEAQCTRDLDCVNDKEPCKIFRCEDLGCLSVAQPDGPAPIQIPGDCKQAICSNGETTPKNDDEDIDDLNPCTSRSCSEGQVLSENLHGVQCALGQATGVCQQGVCQVDCETGADCKPAETPCTEGKCDAGTCVFTGKHGFILPNEKLTDCVQNICNGDDATTVPSLTEVPEDGNECTDNICVNGEPTFPPRTGEECGQNGGECNADGVCVGCSDATDCGVDTACQTPVCLPDEKCDIVNEPVGTIVTLDPVGDCQAVVCDANGNEVSGAHDLDVPGDGDQTDCYLPFCSGGVPSQFLKGENDSCSSGGGTYCNAAGSCVQCNQAAQCGAAAVCTTVACTSNQCVVTNVPAGQNPGGVCPGPVCMGSSFTPGKTCNGAGACSGGGTTTCPGNYSCNAAGTACNVTCNDDGDCQVGFDCVSGNCRKEKGQGCTVGSECASGSCVDQTCCVSGSCSACDSCNVGGHLGDCWPIALGATEPGCNASGMACDGSGNCERVNGQACTMDSQCISNQCTDDVCCNEACDGTCRSCLGLETGGSTGTCANISSNTDPAGECNGGTPRCCAGAMCGPMGCQ
jgi:hypothetical protein